MTRMRWTTWVLIAAFGLAAWIAPAVAKEKSKKKHGQSASSHAGGPEVGKAAPDFTLTGCDGKTYSLAGYKSKIVVLEWINKDCPVSKSYLPKMKDLATKYAKKGIVWLAIDSTGSHTPSDNVVYTKDKAIPYPILSDFDGKVGHMYHAATTPHMFVINKDTTAYMGAIDNKGDKNYVADALDALLLGKEVKTTKTRPFGCSVKYRN